MQPRDRTVSASWPTKNKVSQAFTKAIYSPRTWAPLAGAAVSAGLGLDDEISDWAVDETPIFGSKKAAQKASDDIDYALLAGMLSSIVFLPENPSDPSPVKTKSQVALTEVVGSSLALGTTFSLKRIIGRERPDGASKVSMPSGHATHAFLYSSWIDKNLNYYNVSPNVERAIDITVYSAASLVAWGRIEGQKHYPSDVLVGAAIGNFFTDFFEAAFLESSPVDLSIKFEPSGAVALLWEQSF